MAGGELVVVPIENTGFRPEDATIVGNTCLYGATGGQVFVRGKAGERFAVRNSLAQAVVEGTGDHCCEYMTGGCVVVLGKLVPFLPCVSSGLSHIFLAKSSINIYGSVILIIYSLKVQIP